MIIAIKKQHQNLNNNNNNNNNSNSITTTHSTTTNNNCANLNLNFNSNNVLVTTTTINNNNNNSTNNSNDLNNFFTTNLSNAFSTNNAGGVFKQQQHQQQHCTSTSNTSNQLQLINLNKIQKLPTTTQIINLNNPTTMNPSAGGQVLTTAKLTNSSSSKLILSSNLLTPILPTNDTENYLDSMPGQDESSILNKLSNFEQTNSSSSNTLDDSLTSLQWLQNLNIMKSASNPNSSDCTTNVQSENTAEIKIQPIISSNLSTSTPNSFDCDLDSATIPAATNQSKLSCVTGALVKMPSFPSASSPNPSLNYNQSILNLNYPPLSPPLSIQCSTSPLSTCSSLTSNQSSQSTQSQQTTTNTTTTNTNTNTNTNSTSSTTTKQTNKRNSKKSQQQNDTTSSSNSNRILQHQNSAPAALQTTQTQNLAASTTTTPSSSSVLRNTASFLKDREEYRTNSSVKPPFSYSQLIILSMKESNHSKMTLQMIYDWIIENFSYFKKADPSWQVTFKNSIRHNLSLNKCFKKIARQKDEPGKGGFWTLDPEFEKQNKLNDSGLFPSAKLNLASPSGSSSNQNCPNSSASPKGGSNAKRKRKTPTGQDIIQDDENSTTTSPKKIKTTSDDLFNSSNSNPQQTTTTNFLNNTQAQTTYLPVQFSTSDLDSSIGSTSQSVLLRSDTNWSGENVTNNFQLKSQPTTFQQQQQQSQYFNNNYSQQQSNLKQQNYFFQSHGNQFYSDSQSQVLNYDHLNSFSQQAHHNHNNHNHHHHHQTTQSNQHPQSSHSHNLIVEDITGPFSNSFAHEIIKQIDEDTSLFNFETGLECNFDIDQLTDDTTTNTSTPTSNSSSSNSCSSTSPEDLVNEYLKKSSTSFLRSSTQHHNNHHHGQPDHELIELFEYTSQFTNLDENNNNNNGFNASNLICSKAIQIESSSQNSSSSSPPVDQTTHTKLDLTVQGHGIRHPRWWIDPFVDSCADLNSSLNSSSAMNLLNGEFSSSFARFNGKQEQDDECDSAIFINNNYNQSSSTSSSAETMEFKDFLNNLDSFTNLITPNESLQLKQDQDSDIKIIEPSEMLSSTGQSSKPLNVNTNCSQKKNVIVLSPLSENKTARKRIYTHQNKLNPLLHNNIRIIKAKAAAAEAGSSGGLVVVGASSASSTVITKIAPKSKKK